MSCDKTMCDPEVGAFCDACNMEMKIKELEEKLAEAEKKWQDDANYFQGKLLIATKALEELNEKHGLNYWADICDIAKEALEKITK
jgi:hypothetical protein